MDLIKTYHCPVIDCEKNFGTSEEDFNFHMAHSHSRQTLQPYWDGNDSVINQDNLQIDATSSESMNPGISSEEANIKGITRGSRGSAPMQRTNRGPSTGFRGSAGHAPREHASEDREATTRNTQGMIGGFTGPRSQGKDQLSDRLGLGTLKTHREAGHSVIPRYTHRKRKKSTVSALTKQFEKLSRDFEKQRMRDRKQRAAKATQARAFPQASSKPLVEVYKEQELQSQGPSDKDSYPLNVLIRDDIPKYVTKEIEAAHEGDTATAAGKKENLNGLSEWMLKPRPLDHETAAGISTTSFSERSQEDGGGRRILAMQAGGKANIADPSEDDREAWLETLRAAKRAKRRSSGSVQKRTFSQIIGSDTDDEDIESVTFDNEHIDENAAAQEMFSIPQQDLDDNDFPHRDLESKSEASVTSAAPSLVSINDSIFSIVSGSSMSSLAGPISAIDRLVTLLLNDEAVKSLCLDALTGIEHDRFERNLRRLLKEFAIELRKEAECSQHRQAAQFVRLRARNSAYIICSKLGNKQKVRTVDVKPDDVSEDSGSNGSDGEIDDLHHLEIFIKQSKAIKILRDNLRAFVYYRTAPERFQEYEGNLHEDWRYMGSQDIAVVPNHPIVTPTVSTKIQKTDQGTTTKTSPSEKSMSLVKDRSWAKKALLSVILALPSTFIVISLDYWIPNSVPSFVCAVSLNVLLTTIIQEVQPVSWSAEGYRRINSTVISLWAGRTKRNLPPKDFKVKVLFETPVIFAAKDINQRRTTKNRPIYYINGRLGTPVLSPQEEESQQKDFIGRLHAADDERASSLASLSNLKGKQAQYRKWDEDIDSTPESSVDPQADDTPASSLTITSMQKKPWKRSSVRLDKNKVALQEQETPPARLTTAEDFPSIPAAAKVTSLSSPGVVHLGPTRTEDEDERNKQELQDVSAQSIEARQNEDLLAPEVCIKKGFWSDFLAFRTRFAERLGLRSESAPAGKSRVKWICKCGHTIIDDYEEIRPGALERLAKQMDHSNRSSGRFSAFMQRFSTAVRALQTIFSSKLGTKLASDLPLHELRQKAADTDIEQPRRENPAQDVEPMFLLLIYNERRHITRLLQVDLIKLANESDMALFTVLNKQYKALKRFSWLSLRILDSINFVHFEAYRSQLVDVRQRDALPAPEDPEYRYTPAPPELIPPIGSHYLVHLLENPTCSELEPLCLSRFPKKLKGQLTFAKGMRPGWGLQIVETWDTQKIWLISFFFFGLGSLIIGILWACFKHSIQDAFAIAAYVIAFGTVSVGSIQALLVM